MCRPLTPPGHVLLERGHGKQCLYVSQRHCRHSHRSVVRGSSRWLHRFCVETEHHQGGGRGHPDPRIISDEGSDIEGQVPKKKRKTKHQDEQGRKKKKKIKSEADDHRGITFLDDGKSGKSTKASRECSMITALSKLAPPEQTPLDVLLKRRGQLVNEDQDLLQNLALTQTVLRGTVADDTEGVAWAKLKIGKLRALLSSLVHDHGIDTMTEDTSLTEESD